MLEQDYKELMQEVRPDAALVEKMVEQSKERKRVMLPKAMKVATAVLLGLVVAVFGLTYFLFILLLDYVILR